MNRVGNELLAGAVFALNQDVGVAGGHALDELEEVLHLLALADHVAEAVAAPYLLLEVQVFGPLARQFHRLVEDVDESSLVDRLLEEVERPRLPGLDGPGDAPLSAHHNDLRRLVGFLQPPEQRYPIRVWQFQVGQDHVRPPLAEDFLAPGADQRRPHFVALGFDDDAQPFGHRRFVVDHEYAPAAFRSDRRHTGHFWSEPPTPNLPCDV